MFASAYVLTPFKSGINSPHYEQNLGIDFVLIPFKSGHQSRTARLKRAKISRLQRGSEGREWLRSEFVTGCLKRVVGGIVARWWARGFMPGLRRLPEQLLQAGRGGERRHVAGQPPRPRASRCKVLGQLVAAHRRGRADSRPSNVGHQAPHQRRAALEVKHRVLNWCGSAG